MDCDFRNCPNTESIQEIRRDLDSIEERLRKVEQPMARIDAVVSRIETMVSEQFERIRKIELKLALWMGGIGILSFLLGLAAKYFKF